MCHAIYPTLAQLLRLSCASYSVYLFLLYHEFNYQVTGIKKRAKGGEEAHEKPLGFLCMLIMLLRSIWKSYKDSHARIVAIHLFDNNKAYPPHVTKSFTFFVQNLFRIVSSFCRHHKQSTLVFGAYVMFTSFSYHHLSTTAPAPVLRRIQSSQT